MLIVIFLPGGIMEGFRRIGRWLAPRRRTGPPRSRRSRSDSRRSDDHGGHRSHVDDVHKSFGGLQALTDINLEVEEGKTHAIIGPNGAGKSTLLNVCVGRLKPDTGR